MVSRTSAVTVSPREILPRGITVRGATQVRALAAALCSLPPMPRQAALPGRLRWVVQLVFAAGGRGFQPVHIQDSGCHGVTGTGPTRQWSRVAAVRADAERGGWRHGQAGPRHTPQQRADGAVTASAPRPGRA